MFEAHEGAKGTGNISHFKFKDHLLDYVLDERKRRVAGMIPAEFEISPLGKKLFGLESGKS
jgi:hypothetical protein